MKKYCLLLTTLCAAHYAIAQTNTHAIPFHETFQLASSSLADWDYSNNNMAIVVHNPDVGAFRADSGSVMYNLFNPGSNRFTVNSPLLTSTHKGGFKVSFDFAAAVRNVGPIRLPQDYAQDYLHIRSSRDSGTTFNPHEHYLIADTGYLNTGGIFASPFVPTEQQWISVENIKLPRGTHQVQFEIIRTNQNGTGNMAYLDNVRIDTCHTAMPDAAIVQYDSTFTTLNQLTVTGNELKWYATETGFDTLAHTTPLVDSSYYYVTQTINGCESAPLAIFFADTTTNNNDTNTSVHRLVLDQIKVYPNPARTYLTLSYTDLDEVVIYNTIGQRIPVQWKKHDALINIAHLNTGQYILMMRKDEATKQVAFIKE